MIKWKFEHGIEKGLKEAVEKFVEIMWKYEIVEFNFTIYGFNYVKVGILKTTKNDHIVDILDEDAYTPHFLSGEEYKKWKEKRANLQENGFIQNENLTFEIQGENISDVEPITNEIIAFWKEKRVNELNKIEFELKDKIIVHLYNLEKGIMVYEKEDDY